MDRLEINNEFSFQIVDSLKLEDFKELQKTIIASDKFQKMEMVRNLCNILISKIPTKNFSNHEYETYYNIYSHLLPFKVIGDSKLSDALAFFKRLNKLNRIEDWELNHLLYFYFYSTCIVSFSEAWFMIPEVFISDFMSNGLFSQSSVYKSLKGFDKKVFRFTTSIKIGDSERINMIESSISKELLSVVMKIPSLETSSPIAKEIEMYLGIKNQLNEHPRWKLVIIYNNP